MHKSLRFERPVEETVVWKRPRRRINTTAPREPTMSETFNYKCYDCGSPYEMTNKSSEIECSNCSSRVIRKETTAKPHVLEAI